MPSYALITVSQGWISLSELVDLKQQDRMGTIQVKLSWKQGEMNLWCYVGGKVLQDNLVLLTELIM